MSENLGPMKCIHLDVNKVDMSKYFRKRNIKLLYAQPKLNGIRALWYHQDGLYTSGGNRITSVPHIVEELKIIAPQTDLDGELFRLGMPFNTINGAARRILPNANSLQLEHHVFDTISEQATQSSRLGTVSRLLDCDYIRKVRSCAIEVQFCEKALKDLLTLGFEGIILRDLKALYRPGRHVGNIWAVKPIYELEAEFVGFIDGETDLHQDTFGSMLLRLPNGRTFSCSGITEPQRVELFNNKQLVRGTPITVKFGAWSREDKFSDKAVPLYPRFKCIRWDK